MRNGPLYFTNLNNAISPSELKLNRTTLPHTAQNDVQHLDRAYTPLPWVQSARGCWVES